MKLAWPYQLVLVLSALVVSISCIGLFNYIAALDQVRAMSSGASIDWSVYAISVRQLVLALALAAFGFLGVLLGSPATARVAALTFCIGYALLLCSRWVPVALGHARLPGWLGAGVSASIILGLVGLAYAVRSNNSFERTRVSRAAQFKR